MTLTYDPRIFLCETEEVARSIILMPEAGLSTEDRWEQETAWLAQRMSFPDGLVIDYGCGIGRLSKAIGNPVLGVDLSWSMRSQSEMYVQREAFGAVSPSMLNHLVEAGLQAAGALSVWCLQHCLQPEQDIAMLRAAVRKGGVLYVVNRHHRCIPAQHDGAFIWADDEKSIVTLLTSGGFRLVHREAMPEALCAAGADFMVLTRI